MRISQQVRTPHRSERLTGPNAFGTVPRAEQLLQRMPRASQVRTATALIHPVANIGRGANAELDEAA
eukprot:6736473-Alexandrium_andersonii.AAC.1